MFGDTRSIILQIFLSISDLLESLLFQNDIMVITNAAEIQ